MENNLPTEDRSKIIALIAGDDSLLASLKDAVSASGYSIMQFSNGIELSAKLTKLKLNIVAIVSRSEIIDISGISLFQTLKSSIARYISSTLSFSQLKPSYKSTALRLETQLHNSIMST